MNDRSAAKPSLEQILDRARRAIEVAKAELDEARARRDAIAAALRAEFAGARTYSNGSIAHGDALTPLTDVDLGVVVPDPHHRYGPGRRGPSDLKHRAAEAIRTALKPTYGDLAVEVEGRKRSILVRFRDPVAPGRPDFTADVIVAIDNPTGPGLYIPRWEFWDRSHPEQHTELVLAAIAATHVAYARIVRLLKHWSRRHDKPMCSWHIKALALACITEPTTLLDGLLCWFRYAADQLAQRDTPDPAGVAEKPIKTNKPRPEVVRRLRDAAERLERAVQLERVGYSILALDELAKLFNDPEMLPRPDQAAVTAEEGARIAAEKAKDTNRLGVPSLLTGVGAGARHERPNVRSWAL
jgi:hypothetical protein